MNNLFAFLPMVSSNDLLGDTDALRERLATDGYLYFSQLLPREDVNGVRRDVLRTIAKHGWTDADEFPMMGHATTEPLREQDPEFVEASLDIQRLESFHTLAHHPGMIGLMQQVIGETAFPHPLKVARISFPEHYEISTPPHQDFPNNQGTPGLTTTWIPLSDVPFDLGGLAILRGSQRWGTLPLRPHIGPGNRCAVIPPEMAEECRWVTTEYQQGDVLVFTSHTVHTALHNASVFDLRLSVDYRYQLEGEPLTAGCLEPHFQRLSWDEIYDGWSSTEFQYYWRDLDFDVVPWVDLPVEGREVGNLDLTAADIRAVLRYKQRLDERIRLRDARIEAGVARPDDQSAAETPT